MGMAASQARYLELTARKTNVEYEGQQINQQRTTLANESAGLFSRLMQLQVPTAPSSTDFTTTQYTFTDGDQDYTITDIKNLTGDPDYNRSVTYVYTASEYTGVSQRRTDLGVVGVGTTDDPYWLTNGTTTRKTPLTRCINDPDDKNYETDYTALLQICKDNEDSQIADDLGYDPIAQDLANIDGAYKYTDTNGIIHYYSSTDLANSTSTDGHAVPLSNYYAADIDTEITQTSDAYMATAESGRYSSIQIDGYSTSFPLKSTTTTDENAYNDAMNEYEYQQTSYQKQVNDINAKTSIIKMQDQSLELQLAQLDTEQKALSTEMDSVKKVIDKNIEQTFKTFSN